MTGILIAVAVVAGVGIVIGILLGVAGEKFKVEVDEKEIAVRALLPEITVVDVDILAVMVWRQPLQRERCLLLRALLVVRQLQQRSARSWVWRMRTISVM